MATLGGRGGQRTAGDMGVKPPVNLPPPKQSQRGVLWVKPAGQVRLSNVKGYIILMELAGMDCPMMELAG